MSQSAMGFLHLCLVFTVAQRASCYSDKIDEETGAQHLVHSPLLASKASILVSVSLLGSISYCRCKFLREWETEVLKESPKASNAFSCICTLFSSARIWRLPWQTPYLPALPDPGVEPLVAGASCSFFQSLLGASLPNTVTPRTLTLWEVANATARGFAFRLLWASY